MPVFCAIAQFAISHAHVQRLTSGGSTYVSRQRYVALTMEWRHHNKIDVVWPPLNVMNAPSDPPELAQCACEELVRSNAPANVKGAIGSKGLKPWRVTQQQGWWCSRTYPGMTRGPIPEHSPLNTHTGRSRRCWCRVLCNPAAACCRNRVQCPGHTHPYLSKIKALDARFHLTCASRKSTVASWETTV